jgi:hypothetical protein
LLGAGQCDARALSTAWRPVHTFGGGVVDMTVRWTRPVSYDLGRVCGVRWESCLLVEVKSSGACWNYFGRDARAIPAGELCARLGCR